MTALVFDCDGVLADTEGYGHLPAFNATFAEFGLPVRWSEDEYAEQLRIGGGKERMASLFADPGFVRAAGVPDGADGRRALLARWHRSKTARFRELVATGALPPRPGIARVVRGALTACTPPAKGSPLFELGADEIEIGVGIHGEPGRERGTIKDADEIADELLDAVVGDLPYRSGDRVALMVNGLGGTPVSELYILYRRAHRQLAERGITVGRSYVNEYCTSLDMAGASLTLVRLDEEIDGLLAAPAEAAIRVF